jgi:hypothetical protein
MVYSALTAVEVSDVFTLGTYDKIKDNLDAGIPGVYTAKGQIAAGSGSQALGVLDAPAVDGKVLAYDTGAGNGLAWVGGRVEIGMIILWSGSIATIPIGWQICDGTNGTPDLRDFMVRGAGLAYAPGDSGGGTGVTHTHVQTDTSTSSDAFAHTHSAGGMQMSLSGAHAHATSGTTGVDDPQGGDVDAGAVTYAAGDHTHDWNGTDTDGAHYHVYPADTDSGGLAHAHGTLPGLVTDSKSIMPPYYALAYIMRLS